MFCPKCCDKMQEYENTHKCFRGEMDFSPHFNSEIIKLLENTPNQKLEAENAEQMSLFCPRCSNRMFYNNEKRLSCICLDCGLEFPTRLFYQLIEFHPHKNQKGEWI